MKPAAPVRLWLGWVALVHGAFSYFSWFHSELLASPAYDFATRVLPIEAWGVVSILVTIVLVCSLLTHSMPAAFIGLGMALPTQVVFGASIFVLTLSGQTAAIIGSFQWWTMGVGNAVILWAAASHGIRMETE